MEKWLSCIKKEANLRAVSGVIGLFSATIRSIFVRGTFNAFARVYSLKYSSRKIYPICIAISFFISTSYSNDKG